MIVSGETRSSCRDPDWCLGRDPSTVGGPGLVGPDSATGASRSDLQPFVRECLAAGFTLDPKLEASPRPDPNNLGNVFLRWTDGRLLLAVPWTRTLVDQQFEKHDLTEFVTIKPAQPKLDVNAPIPTVRHTQRSLFA